LKKEQTKPNGMNIQNAHEVVTYLKAKSNKYHASHLATRKMVHKYIWEVKEGDIDRARTFDCSIVQGRRKAHQMRNVNCHDPTQVQYRHLSCFYPCCVNGDVVIQSEEISHVPPSTFIKLKPLNNIDIRETMHDSNQEVEFGTRNK